MVAEDSFPFLRNTVASRSFLNKSPLKLTKDARRVLEQTLVEGQVEFDLKDPGVQTCFTEGWLQTELLDNGERVVLVYPTVLHAKWVSAS